MLCCEQSSQEAPGLILSIWIIQFTLPPTWPRAGFPLTANKNLQVQVDKTTSSWGQCRGAQEAKEGSGHRRVPQPEDLAVQEAEEAERAEWDANI